MKFRELLDLLKDEPNGIVLQIKEAYFDDQYLDPGMRATLIGSHDDDWCGDDDEFVWLELDCRSHVAHNVPLEERNYWDGNGNATLTASECGYAPPFRLRDAKDPYVEELCVGLDEEMDKYFEFV